MLNLSGEPGRKVIESDQLADSFASTSVDGRVAVRLCSVRCQESQVGVAPNQDYARVVFASHGSSLSFCVCDGVGGSYLGDFAARYLAHHLTDYLLALPAIPRNPRKTAVALRKQLKIWAREAHTELCMMAPPHALSALEREILAEQRDQHGSATVFFSGRIDDLSSQSTRSARTLSALFCWMGNVTAHVFSSPSACLHLGDPQNDRNRWSTLYGQQGLLTIRVNSLNKSDSLLIHTDGLDSLGHELIQLDDQQLQKRIWQLLSLPANDDMTVLELRWDGPGVKR